VILSWKARSQINDRISFKEFLQLPLHMPSPDHSTLSRFRSRLSKKGMMTINSELLNQFAKEGFPIDQGIAIDAGLVRSASRPISNADIKSLGDKKNSPEGKIDKNGNPIKFSRDAESVWTVKNDKSHYGLDKRASVDINNGFILATTITPASQRFPLLALLHYLHPSC
jgi:IS5 family transposase